MNSMAALVLIPLLGAFITFVLPRYARITGILIAICLPGLALSLALQVYANGPLNMSVGGWAPPQVI